MKIIRLVLGLLVSIMLLTVLVEIIELLIVKFTSGKSIEELQTDQLAYFEVRNQNWILFLKAIYTFLATLIAGWLGSKITKYYKSTFFILSVVAQLLAFSYAAFFSAFKNTLPARYWVLLMLVVLFGFSFSYLMFVDKRSSRS